MLINQFEKDGKKISLVNNLIYLMGVLWLRDKLQNFSTSDLKKHRVFNAEF